ncbi:thioredoxin 1 [Alkalibacterium olivapovliticus]|uniref:Thioredoxin n=1 Tax=Alkalibacterium olivapovliticus TaxID=99907 RepID=A0A2T0VZS0_9LACT|nr:thioredoxin 1 [Alkalibacterium olivapovliticus]
MKSEGVAVTLNEDNFLDTVRSRAIVLVHFTSDFCGPCHAMGHALSKLEKENEQMLVAEVKAMDHTEWLEAFTIQSTPTTLLFYQGKYISRISGAHPTMTIEKWIKEATA